MVRKLMSLLACVLFVGAIALATTGCSTTQAYQGLSSEPHVDQLDGEMVWDG